jgi:hypothetical protein
VVAGPILWLLMQEHGTDFAASAAMQAIAAIAASELFNLVYARCANRLLATDADAACAAGCWPPCCCRADTNAPVAWPWRAGGADQQHLLPRPALQAGGGGK